MTAEARSVFAFPKSPLHAHLILSARRETMSELADRYGVDVADAWSCGSLGELILESSIAFDLIRTPDDLARLCREFVEDEAAQGVYYTRPMMGVGFYARRAFGLTDEQLAEIARTSARASGAPAETVARMLVGIDAWLATDPAAFTKP